MPKHAINLESDADSLDAERLPQMIRLWLDDCGARLPPYTVAGYADKVNYFTTWWTGVAEWKRHELTRSDLHDFARWLANTTTIRKKPLSLNTRHDVLRRLAQCLRWAYAERHYTPIDISAWVPTLPPGKRTKRVATVDELRRLMEAADQAQDPLRDRAVIALLMQTGMRRAEVRSIAVTSITMMAGWSGTLRVVGKRTTANTTGERIVVFDAFAGSHLAAYLDAHGWPDGPLLRNEAGNPVAPKTVERIVKRAVARAGLSDVIQGPHDLRRAFVTHFRRKNRGSEFDKFLQLQVGHTAPKTTDMYDMVELSDMVDVIRGPLW